MIWRGWSTAAVKGEIYEFVKRCAAGASDAA